MLCRKCRKEIPADSVYCNYCGTNQTLSHKPKSRGNGQGSVYQLPNKKWRVQVTLGYNLDENGTKRRKCHTKEGFKTKKEALEYLHCLDRDNCTKQEPTIDELYKFIKSRDIDKLSADKQSHYRTAYKRIELIHRRKLSTVSLAELQDIIDGLELGYYPCRDVKNVLSKIYEYALIEEYCNRNLAQYLQMPAKNETERAVFEKNEIKQLWDAWKNQNEFAGAILVMIYAGLRTGELLNIRSDSVDTERSIMYGGIKTAKGKARPLLIINRIKPIIEHYLRMNNEKLFLYSEHSFYEEWAKLKETLKFRNELVPYCARHTCATALSESQTAPAIAMDILGHESYQTTIRYTHTHTQQLLEALENAM